MVLLLAVGTSTVGDEGCFGNFIKMEVIPVALPQNKEIKDVFSNQNNIDDIMSSIYKCCHQHIS